MPKEVYFTKKRNLNLQDFLHKFTKEFTENLLNNIQNYKSFSFNTFDNSSNFAFISSIFGKVSE